MSTLSELVLTVLGFFDEVSFKSIVKEFDSSLESTKTISSEGFLVTGFLAAGFLTAGFLAAGFLAAGFLAAGFLTAGFLAAGFLAAGFLVADFFPDSSEDDLTSLVVVLAPFLLTSGAFSFSCSLDMSFRFVF